MLAVHSEKYSELHMDLLLLKKRTPLLIHICMYAYILLVYSLYLLFALTIVKFHVPHYYVHMSILFWLVNVVHFAKSNEAG